MLKVTKLTAMNHRALDEELTSEEREKVTLSKTTATFHMPGLDAVEFIETVRDRAAVNHGRTGHPVASLHSVVRKAKDAADQAIDADEAARAEDDGPVERTAVIRYQLFVGKRVEHRQRICPESKLDDELRKLIGTKGLGGYTWDWE